MYILITVVLSIVFYKALFSFFYYCFIIPIVLILSLMYRLMRIVIEFIITKRIMNKHNKEFKDKFKNSTPGEYHRTSNLHLIK